MKNLKDIMGYYSQSDSNGVMVPYGWYIQARNLIDFLLADDDEVICNFYDNSGYVYDHYYTKNDISVIDVLFDDTDIAIGQVTKKETGDFVLEVNAGTPQSVLEDLFKDPLKRAKKKLQLWLFPSSKNMEYYLGQKTGRLYSRNYDTSWFSPWGLAIGQQGDIEAVGRADGFKGICNGKSSFESAPDDDKGRILSLDRLLKHVRLGNDDCRAIVMRNLTDEERLALCTDLGIDVQ